MELLKIKHQAQSLMLFLKSRLVYHHGFYNQSELSKGDILTLEEWIEKGYIKRTKLGKSRQKKGTIAQQSQSTHKIQFSELAWNTAQALERERVFQVSTIIPNPAPAPTATPTISPKEFLAYCSYHNKPLSEDQTLFAERIIEAINQPDLNHFRIKPDTGKSHVLRSFDMYMHMHWEDVLIKHAREKT